MLSRHSAGLVVAACLFSAACGGTTTAEEPTGAQELPLFFAAHDPVTEALFVARIAPREGEVATFGPALPDVTALTHDVDRILFSEDHTRVVVSLSPVRAPGIHRVLASDGGPWRLVAESAHRISVSISDSAEILWLDRACDDTFGDASRPALATFSGAYVWEAETCAAARDASVLQRFLPGADKALVVENGRDFVLRDAAGGRTPVRGYPAPTAERSVSALEVFATSAIVRTAADTLEWIGFDGAVLAVPGFAGKLGAVSWEGYQVADGQLFRLVDRGVEPLQRLPDGTNVGDVRAHVEGPYAVVDHDEGLELVDRDGALRGSYAPQGSGTTTTNGVFVPKGRSWGVVPYQVHGASQGDYIPMIGYGEDLVVFADGAVTAKPLRAVVDRGGVSLANPPRLRSYQPSSSGAYLVYTEAGTFHRVTIATLADDVLTTTLEPPSNKAGGLGAFAWIEKRR